MAKSSSPLTTNVGNKSTIVDRQAGFMEALATNVQSLAKAQGVTYSAILQLLAEKAGVSSSAVSNYWTGKRMWPTELLIILADHLSTSVDNLMGRSWEAASAPASRAEAPRRSFTGFPDQPTPPGSVNLPEFDISYAMGGGALLADHADATTVAFPRDWLRPIIRGSFDQVFIARGEGDSMQPTLLDGDITIIDTAQRALNSQDRLWAIQYGELGMIKRLRAQPDGGILVLSDNPTVAAFTAYDGEVQLIGRVVWIGRRV